MEVSIPRTMIKICALSFCLFSAAVMVGVNAMVAVCKECNGKEVKVATQDRDISTVASQIRKSYLSEYPESRIQQVRKTKAAMYCFVQNISRLEEGNRITVHQLLDWCISQYFVYARKDSRLASEIVDLLDQASITAPNISASLHYLEQKKDLIRSICPNKDSFLFHEQLASLYRKTGDLQKAEEEDRVVNSILNRPPVMSPVDPGINGVLIYKQDLCK